jgi:hypothetical protein
MVQRDGEPRAGGIGAAPPAESFVVAEGVGGEDRHVLFARDSVELTSAARQQLVDLAAGYSGPVTVEIHGYASTEGDAAYNSNLSAHRAAAVRAILLPLLPPGSVVQLYAHGETGAFGALPNNRRSGVRMVAGAPTGTSAERAEPQPSAGGLLGPRGGWSFDPTLRGLQPQRPSLGLRLTPPLLPAPLPTRPPISALDLRIPPQPGSPQIDWLEMRRPFLNRGLTLSDRDAAAIEGNWMMTYNSMLRLGLSPGQAAWVANRGLAYAYDSRLSLEQPGAYDRFQQEDERTRRILYPGEIRTPIVPILTPGTLNSIVRWLSGRDINFEF